MTLFLSSLLSGMLTILAPCVLPVLPVILAGSITEKKQWYPFVVTISLALSIVIFTIGLKATTLLIDIPSSFWKYLSASILMFLGGIYIFPHVWTSLVSRFGFSSSYKTLDSAQDISSPFFRAVLTGGALGPVFSTCSPTYSLLLATVFPISFLSGVFYILVYALGLGIMIAIIAIGGRGIIRKLHGIADERGWFKKILGLIFIAIGFMIILGIDKQFESFILDRFDPTIVENTVINALR